MKAGAAVLPDVVNPVDWDGVFAALQAWRASESSDPSVTALSTEFRRDPWAVLVSTVLSLRTKDEVTEVASRRLLARAPTPPALIALGEEETAKLAYPAGFYRTKARNLVAIAGILESRWGGLVPNDLDSLLSLPGVGRKAANLILTEAFDEDAICVDTHVHRISKRMGWVDEPTPDRTETALARILPRRYWKRINALLVLYGQRVCRPVSPRCSACVVADRCARRGVGRSR